MSSVASVRVSVKTGEISGVCDPRFSLVAAEFERNFQERGEVGASVCVTLGGETMVDLWGGLARPATQVPWGRDTIAIIWSATKGATALCAHMLATRGQLDLDAPVSRYWPEFAQAGKDQITVALLLCHQAGLPAVRTPLPPGAFNDWDLMTRTLAAQEPLWQPGSRHGYHAFTFGWLVGEVVRQVSGKSLGAYFRDEVVRPLGLDFWIGLPEDQESRTAQMILQDPPSPDDPITPFNAAMMDTTSVQALVMGNTGGHMMPGTDGVFGFDTPAAHRAEIGAAGGMSNGRGLAGLYAPLANGGALKGVNLVNRDALARMSAVASASGLDATILAPTRFSLGYVKSVDNRRVAGLSENDSVILSEEAFGHSGFGGAMGFADPAVGLSFGYVMNKMGTGLGLNARGQRLIDATYQSVGYSSNASGRWLK
jgi:CubicO group peptidase (beta-lactamase class C family)